MAGKIEYSLGLATAGFLGPLGNVASKLSGFLGATASLGAAASAVFSQINRGGALVDLSNRTGESVKDLYQLEHAFKQTGVSASGVAPLLQRYRQSLSGVGEMGESTAEAFQLLGTSIEELKGLNAPDALQKMFSGFAKLDRNTAAGVAGKIFGRGASGDILQMSRDANGFADALQRAAPHAEQMARNAAAFDRLGDTLGDLRLEFDGIAATVAEKITPALNLLTTQLRDKDFAGLGEVFELSMKAAIQETTFFLADAATDWGDIVRKSMKSAANEATSARFWEKAGKGTLGVAAGLAGLWGQFGGALGIPGAQEQGDLRIAQAEKLFQAVGLGGGVLSDVANEMARNPGTRNNPFREALKKMIEADQKRAAEDTAKDPDNKNIGPRIGTLVSGAGLSGQYRIDANALQRAGLWNANGTGNDMRAIKGGVVSMVAHLAAIRQAVAGGGGATLSFANK